ncbi:MAG TPA: hypothetical protein VIX89_10890 [Bryobacteraceae bacterium]
MARFPVKILIVFSIAMALANARCVAQCLVQSCESGGDHCHSHGKSNAGLCSHQHEMTVASVDSQTTGDAVQFLLPVASASLESQDIWFQMDVPAPSPPLLFRSTAQTLRI